MRVPWVPRRRNGDSRWIEVAPGEQGTAEDEFTSFTYWVPSDRLVAEIEQNARDAGRNLLPDVTAPGELDEPDGHAQLRGIVIDACYGRRSAAIEIFKAPRQRIAELCVSLQNPTATPANPGRTESERNRDLGELAGLEALLESLEDALESRLRQLVAYFDTLSAEFVQELMNKHPYPALVESRWKPTGLELPADTHDFGQGTSRKQIAELRGISQSREEDA